MTLQRRVAAIPTTVLNGVGPFFVRLGRPGPERRPPPGECLHGLTSAADGPSGRRSSWLLAASGRPEVSTLAFEPGERRTLTTGTAIALACGMWLDAVVTTADLQNVVAQLTPATIPLGGRGHLFFDAPAEVSLVAERGLRVRCHATLRWPILGIDVAITIRSMTLLVVPSIELRDGNRVIVLTPEVDALDLALLPDVGDDELRAFINRELQERRIELPWNYKETLDHQFALPDWFQGGAIFEIRSNGAAIKVTNDSIGLAIGISASVATDENAHLAQPKNGEPRHRDHRSRALARVSPRNTTLATYQRRKRRLGLALAIAGGFGLGCLVGLKQVHR